jgi:hypothetical protein
MCRIVTYICVSMNRVTCRLSVKEKVNFLQRGRESEILDISIMLDGVLYCTAIHFDSYIFGHFRKKVSL